MDFLKMLFSMLGIKHCVKKNYRMHSYRHGSFATNNDCSCCSI